MDRRRTTARSLRRTRRALAMVAAATAILIAAVCRLGAASRLVAAIGVVACLLIWVMLLDREGRLSERMEQRSRRSVPPAARSRREGAPSRPVAHRRAA